MDQLKKYYKIDFLGTSIAQFFSITPCCSLLSLLLSRVNNRSPAFIFTNIPSQIQSFIDVLLFQIFQVWSTLTKHQTATLVTHLGEAELLHNMRTPKRRSQEHENDVWWGRCSESSSSGLSSVKYWKCCSAHISNYSPKATCNCLAFVVLPVLKIQHSIYFIVYI